MRIYLVVNISQVIGYREQVERQKLEKVKPVKIDGIKKQKVEKILDKENKRDYEISGILEEVYSKK